MTEKLQIVRRETQPVSAEHWSGGDTLLKERMRAGGHYYWTVIEILPSGATCAALDGRRFSSETHAKRALDRHLVAHDHQAE